MKEVQGEKIEPVEFLMGRNMLKMMSHIISNMHYISHSIFVVVDLHVIIIHCARR